MIEARSRRAVGVRRAPRRARQRGASSARRRARRASRHSGARPGPHKRVVHGVPKDASSLDEAIHSTDSTWLPHHDQLRAHRRRHAPCAAGALDPRAPLGLFLFGLRRLRGIDGGFTAVVFESFDCLSILWPLARCQPRARTGQVRHNAQDK